MCISTLSGNKPRFIQAPMRVCDVCSTWQTTPHSTSSKDIGGSSISFDGIGKMFLEPYLDTGGLLYTQSMYCMWKTNTHAGTFLVHLLQETNRLYLFNSWFCVKRRSRSWLICVCMRTCLNFYFTLACATYLDQLSHIWFLLLQLLDVVLRVCYSIVRLIHWLLIILMLKVVVNSNY